MKSELRLDVRSIPQWQRHPRIFAMYDALLAGQSIVITSDHEPRPLHAQFQQRYGKRYIWEQRRLGDGRWEVRIAKSAVPEEDRSPFAVLARNAVFSKLAESELRSIAARVRRASIKRHHAAVDQGVNWPYVGIVESGIVQAVLVTATGREQAIYDVLADELFGETRLLDGGLSALRHVALTANTQVLLVPIEIIEALPASEPAMFAALAQLAAQRYRTTLERFSAHFGTSAAARIAQVLLPFAAPGNGLCGALTPLPEMTQPELATSAGTVKEVVSRALGEMEAAGALQREGGHIVRLDRAKLNAIAEM